MVGVLSQGGDQEQALARMLEGRRAADLKTHELDHIVQVLTDASFLEAQKEVRVTRQAVQFGDHHDGVMEAAEGQGLGKARTVVTLAATSTNSAISFHLPP